MSTADAAISEAGRAWLDAVLAPVEVPPGSSSRDVVRDAIRFGMDSIWHGCGSPARLQ